MPPRDATRRTVLATTALALPALVTRRSRAGEQITVADPGGPYSPAYRRAFYDPFEAATGIKVIGVNHPPESTAQFRAMVETQSFIWDVSLIAPGHALRLMKPRNDLAPLGVTQAMAKGFMPNMVTPDWLGMDVFATVMAYRTDKFPENGPQSWADFWDTAKFPGRRALYKLPAGTLEAALMADGVAPADLYPMDLDRAFRSLDRIRKHVSVWWSSGAACTQMLQSGEVDMLLIWNARAQTAIDAGAPARIVWNQGLYSSDGWVIPAGSPKADIARQFVRFCLDPARHAMITETLAYGPTNLDCYAHIPPARAPLLPTYAPNLSQIRPVDDVWWTENFQRVSERFEDWLLSG
jgi:putative spermidine/putrescine transport system substrate-binding protein